MKISMACWQIANESVTKEKIAACKKHGVVAGAGGGPLEVAAYFDRLPQYLDLCMHVGIERVEAGEGFLRTNINPAKLIQMANDRNLQVQFELGEKHAGAFDGPVVDALIRQGLEWLNAGAKQLVIEARESALGVGLFDDAGRLNEKLAQRFMDSFGEEHVIFEAPVKKRVSLHCWTSSVLAFTWATFVWRNCSGWKSTVADCTRMPSRKKTCAHWVHNRRLDLACLA